MRQWRPARSLYVKYRHGQFEKGESLPLCDLKLFWFFNIKETTPMTMSLLLHFNYENLWSLEALSIHLAVYD